MITSREKLERPLQSPADEQERTVQGTSSANFFRARLYRHTTSEAAVAPHSCKNYSQTDAKSITSSNLDS